MSDEHKKYSSEPVTFDHPFPGHVRAYIDPEGIYGEGKTEQEAELDLAWAMFEENETRNARLMTERDKAKSALSEGANKLRLAEAERDGLRSYHDAVAPLIERLNETGSHDIILRNAYDELQRLRLAAPYAVRLAGLLDRVTAVVELCTSDTDDEYDRALRPLIAEARAALAKQGHEIGGEIPEGWKLVPEEPTDAMLNAMFAGVLNDNGLKIYRNRWRALLTEIPESTMQMGTRQDRGLREGDDPSGSNPESLSAPTSPLRQSHSESESNPQADPQHPVELAVIRRAHEHLGRASEHTHPGSEAAYLALSKFLRELPSPGGGFTPIEELAQCSVCGETLELVRPGKWQHFGECPGVGDGQ